MASDTSRWNQSQVDVYISSYTYKWDNTQSKHVFANFTNLADKGKLIDLLVDVNNSDYSGDSFGPLKDKTLFKYKGTALQGIPENSTEAINMANNLSILYVIPVTSNGGGNIGSPPNCSQVDGYGGYGLENCNVVGRGIRGDNGGNIITGAVLWIPQGNNINRSTLAHEFAHCTGFDHNDICSPTMINQGVSTMQPNDIEAYAKRYWTGTYNSPCD